MTLGQMQHFALLLVLAVHSAQGLLLEPAAGRALRAPAAAAREPPELDLAPTPEDLADEEAADGGAGLSGGLSPLAEGFAAGVLGKPGGVRDTVRLAGANLGPKLRSGLANQLITFIYLVIEAASKNADIDLASVRWRGDWKHNDTVPHELIWDVPRWNLDPHLPKLTTVSGGGAVHSVNGSALFRSYLQETAVLRKDPEAQRSWWEHYVLLRLVPAKGIADVVDRLRPPGPYGAVHARVELDLELSQSMLKHRVSLPRIYGLMGESAALAGLPPEDKQSIFLAVSGDVDAETAALLQRGRGPWAGSAAFRAGEAAARRLPKQFNGCQYLAASVIDYQICLHADWFVGHTMSTFTNMLVYDRTANHRGLLNLYYNERALAVRCDDGRLDVSRQNYTAFRQANGTACP